MLNIHILLPFLTLLLWTQGILTKNEDAKKSKEKELSEITRGNCKDAKDRDMVFHELVLKSEVPFLTRNATSSWFGDHKIYCIKVLNEYKRKYKQDGNTAIIKEGGVGHNFVTIEMHSETGQPIQFLVLVYGEKGAKGGKKNGKSKHKKA